MKPQRMAMTHQLVLGYGLHKHLDVYVSVDIWMGSYGCVLVWMCSCMLPTPTACCQRPLPLPAAVVTCQRPLCSVQPCSAQRAQPAGRTECTGLLAWRAKERQNHPRHALSSLSCPSHVQRPQLARFEELTSRLLSLSNR